MNWYPQLLSGASVQLPMSRKRSWRGIENVLESGEAIYTPDLHGGLVTWDLEYQALTDAEVTILTAFFASVRGKFGTFGFADPLANLLAGSEDLGRSEWSAGTMGVVGGATGPTGDTVAWIVSNSAAGPQELQQTVSVPGGLLGCFSFWARALAPTIITARRDTNVTNLLIGPSWRRVWISGAGDPSLAVTTVALGIPAGGSIQVFGLQLEMQPYPGKYIRTSATAGSYLNTSFTQDELAVVQTGPGLSSCKVKLTSRI